MFLRACGARKGLRLGAHGTEIFVEVGEHVNLEKFTFLLLRADGTYPLVAPERCETFDQYFITPSEKFKDKINISLLS